MAVWRAWLVFGALVVATLPGDATAQDGPRRFELGIDLNGIVPTGDFQQFVDLGGGLNVSFLWQLDQRRHFGLRFEGSAALYGHERFQVPLLPSTGRIVVDVTTDNWIFGFGAGPQVTFLSGRLRPYAFATAGFADFATISSVSGSANVDDFASTTNFDDWTASLSAGAGFTWRITSGRRPIALGGSGRYVYNGVVTYLTKGGVVDNPDGSVTVFPIRSSANYVAIRMGMTIGF
jgi:hypothetical protein